MTWLVEDLAEAVLGPWALALGAGVALVMLARRPDAIPRWWRERYAEAEAEWRAERRAGGREASARLRGAVAAGPGGRARDARGRFVTGPAV